MDEVENENEQRSPLLLLRHIIVSLFLLLFLFQNFSLFSRCLVISFYFF